MGRRSRTTSGDMAVEFECGAYWLPVCRPCVSALCVGPVCRPAAPRHWRFAAPPRLGATRNLDSQLIYLVRNNFHSICEFSQ